MNIFTLSAKSCMSHLLLKDTFDRFSFIESEITTFNKFTIDGYLHKDFYDEAFYDAEGVYGGIVEWDWDNAGSYDYPDD